MRLTTAWLGLAPASPSSFPRLLLLLLPLPLLLPLLLLLLLLLRRLGWLHVDVLCRTVERAQGVAVAAGSATESGSGNDSCCTAVTGQRSQESLC